MHEVSLVQALFDQADRAIGDHARRDVRHVTVRIGELAGVENDLFATAFEACRGERGYGDATLAIVREEAAWVCGSCGASAIAPGSLRCGRCDGAARLVRGGDIFLDRLELEVVDV